MQQLRHPREVFYSDESDINYVTTIASRTVVVHRDCLPPDFDLDSLRVGDHFFYRSKYERKTRSFIPVDAPGRHVDGGRGEGGGGVGGAGAAQVGVLEEDIETLLRNTRMH